MNQISKLLWGFLDINYLLSDFTNCPSEQQRVNCAASHNSVHLMGGATHKTFNWSEIKCCPNQKYSLLPSWTLYISCCFTIQVQFKFL